MKLIRPDLGSLRLNFIEVKTPGITIIMQSVAYFGRRKLEQIAGRVRRNPCDKVSLLAVKIGGEMHSDKPFGGRIPQKP